MPSENTLMALNTIHTQFASLVRAIVIAMADGKLTAWEGMSIGMQGVSLASALLTLLQGVPPNVRAELFHILEHGQWVVPPP